MIGALFDPALLLPSDETWRNATSRDKFLTALLDHLDMLETLGSICIYWADELEERLWSEPPIPPWREDSAWRNPLVPILYKKFGPLKLLVAELCGTPATLIPQLLCVCEHAAALFLRLLQTTIQSRPPICLGGANTAVSEFTVVDRVGAAEYGATLIRDPRDWLDLVDVESTFWPTGRHDGARLATCLELVRLRDYPDTRFLYDMAFSPRFLDDVRRAGNREAIASALIRRLTTTQQGAASNNRLRDEALPGEKRRMRVTGAERIHYVAETHNTLHFKRYYGPGEHDDGL